MSPPPTVRCPSAGRVGLGRESRHSNDPVTDGPRDVADPLFSVTTTGKAFDDQRRKAAEYIAALPPERLQTRGLDDLTAEVVERYRIDPLVLVWHAKRGESRDVEIDVGGDVKVPGKKITYYVPFTGPAGLFEMRPSTYTESPPQGVVGEQELQISYSGVEPDPATIRREFERQESDLNEWVSWIKTDVDAFAADLMGRVRAQVKARVDKARADTDLLTALGVPLRQRPSIPRRGAPSLVSRGDGRPPPPIVPPGPRRARVLADPIGAFHRALVDAINLGESRLSKTAIAARMGVDRKTLGKYITDGLIPPPPWEAIAADLVGTSRPR